MEETLDPWAVFGSLAGADPDDDDANTPANPSDVPVGLQPRHHHHQSSRRRHNQLGASTASRQSAAAALTSFLLPISFSAGLTCTTSSSTPGSSSASVDANMEYVQASYRAATSKTAQRTLLNSVLAITVSTFLFVCAAVAYLLFYHSYLPEQVTTVPVHLQYGYGLNPFGTASLANRNLKDLQAYDITVTLSLPRSPANLERGNFMIALHLLDGSSASLPSAASAVYRSVTGKTATAVVGGPAAGTTPDASSLLAQSNVLFSSTRPTLIPYTDPLVSLASRVLFLFYHIFYPHAESVTLRVPLAERVSFGGRQRPGSSAAAVVAPSLPSSLLLELQAGQTLQVYEAAVELSAQLSGLRWLMYRHRLVAFVLFTTAFWMCEVAFMAGAWALVAMRFPAAGDEDDGTGSGVSRGAGAYGGAVAVKTEKGRQLQQEQAEDDLSDTERTFPVQGRQPPLRYESTGGRAIKDEPGERSALLGDVPAAGAEADDEDDEVDQFRDSGIGTSYSDASLGQLRRRSSRGGLR